MSELQKLAKSLEVRLGDKDGILMERVEIELIMTVLLSAEIIIIEKQKIIDRFLGDGEKSWSN